jgi:hypothetical protein
VFCTGLHAPEVHPAPLLSAQYRLQLIGIETQAFFFFSRLGPCLIHATGWANAPRWGEGRPHLVLFVSRLFVSLALLCASFQALFGRKPAGSEAHACRQAAQTQGVRGRYRAAQALAASSSPKKSLQPIFTWVLGGVVCEPRTEYSIDGQSISNRIAGTPGKQPRGRGFSKLRWICCRWLNGAPCALMPVLGRRKRCCEAARRVEG